MSSWFAAELTAPSLYAYWSLLWAWDQHSQCHQQGMPKSMQKVGKCVHFSSESWPWLCWHPSEINIPGFLSDHLCLDHTRTLHTVAMEEMSQILTPLTSTLLLSPSLDTCLCFSNSLQLVCSLDLPSKFPSGSQRLPTGPPSSGWGADGLGVSDWALLVNSSLFSTPSPAFIVCRFFVDDNSDWCEMISHCSFDLHFSND